MTWLKRIAIALVVLLLLGGVAGWWVLDTQSGLRFVLARVQSAMGGALAVGRAEGTLAGPLTIETLHYADGQGTDVRIGRATLDADMLPLLGGNLSLSRLRASDIRVSLPASQASTSSKQGGFSLKPPLDIDVDDAVIRDLAIRRGGETLFRADSIDTAGHWRAGGIALRKLAVRAPNGHIDAQGRLSIGGSYRGRGQARFEWTQAGRTYAGKLTTKSDGDKANVNLDLEQPLQAHARLAFEQRRTLPWHLKLRVPRGDAASLLGSGQADTLAADLEGQGDRRHANLHGTVDYGRWQLRVNPLRLTLDEAMQRLTVDTLKLQSKQIKGSLQASGHVALDAQPLSADLKLDWRKVELPASLAGQVLDSEGHLTMKGSLDDYRSQGHLKIGPPGRLSKLELALHGDTSMLAFDTLTLDQPSGHVDVTGTLQYAPAVSWSLQAEGRKFDPGQLFAGWDGALDFDLASSGERRDQGLDASLDIRRLDGRLRQRPVNGKGRLHLSPQEVVDGRLSLSAGKSHVDIQAASGSRNDIHARLRIASLADWLPDAAGSLNGEADLTGKLDALALDGHLHAEGLRWQGQQAQSLDLDAHMPNVRKPGGHVAAHASGVQSQHLSFARIEIDAHGSQAQHEATLHARGQQLNADLALEGHSKGAAWQGRLTALRLEPAGMPPWRLQSAVPITLDGGELDLSQLCLSAGDPHLCIEGHRKADGSLKADYRLAGLPLALPATLLSEAALPLSADGQVNGQGTLQRSASGNWTGHAELHSEHGELTWLDDPQHPLLAWSGLRAHADLDGDTQALELHGRLSDEGHVDGRVSLSGPQHALQGRLELKLGSLAFAELLNHDLANVSGTLDGRFTFGGTLDQPVMAGQASVDGFAAEIPRAGLKLKQGHFTASTRDARQFQIDGSVQSGQGTLQLGGHAGIGADTDTAITLKGSKVLAADIPAAHVVISPDLTVKRSDAVVSIDGTVHVDSADVDVSKLPGAGVTHASPDVVVMDAPNRQQSGSTAMAVNVSIELGDDTQLKGFGLNGALKGTLAVRQQPGHAPLGQGQIRVDGTYHAYGQDLKIQRGQLLFASTPLENPGLNIRAVRSLNPNATVDEGQQVGLMITGTAARPVINVFSTPAMAQSDALSYLVTGKPLSQVRGGEGNMVGAAARALGSATGDLLAKSIGSKLGIDDIGVSSNQALGGSAAFTVGKYLSPSLYLSYGVGLFEPGTVVTLRYLLSSRWNFEATQATTFSRASFNYRYEK